LQKKVFVSQREDERIARQAVSKAGFYSGMDELQAAVVAEFCIEGVQTPEKTM
jgi:hypothetical protein